MRSCVGRGGFVKRRTRTEARLQTAPSFCVWVTSVGFADGLGVKSEPSLRLPLRFRTNSQFGETLHAESF